MADNPLLLAAALILAAAVGWLIAFLMRQRQLHDLREKNSAMTATLELERRHAQEKLENLEKAREQLSQTFAALSSQALKHNSDEFLKLAQENLKQMHIKAQAELSQKEKSFETLVKPIKEALDKTEKQIREMEQARKEAYGSLHKHLETMTQTQQVLQTETRNLVQALRRPEVRGQWGEITLKRLVELAGMVEHCDFYPQETTRTEDGALRPDMIIRMPDKREIVVDVKTPLDAYLSAVEAPDEAQRKAALERHARFVRERVRALSGKAYWSQFQHSPDFVVMFIPGDQFLTAALDLDRNLLEDAMGQKVILATPTSFVALLRAVGYGWRQQALAENAEKIRAVGEDLYKRLATFTEHLSKVGKHLESTTDHYNKAIGSLERQVFPGARRFTEMGIHTAKVLEEPAPVEKTVRSFEAPDQSE
jgi:DNA recombination protein RmuC